MFRFILIGTIVLSCAGVLFGQCPQCQQQQGFQFNAQWTQPQQQWQAPVIQYQAPAVQQWQQPMIQYSQPAFQSIPPTVVFFAPAQQIQPIQGYSFAAPPTATFFAPRMEQRVRSGPFVYREVRRGW
jgi:hypothetical protein